MTPSKWVPWLLLLLLTPLPAQAGVNCAKVQQQLNRLKRDLDLAHRLYQRAGCGKRLLSNFDAKRRVLLRQRASKSAIRKAYSDYRNAVARCRRLAAAAVGAQQRYNVGLRRNAQLLRKCRAPNRPPSRKVFVSRYGAPPPMPRRGLVRSGTAARMLGARGGSFVRPRGIIRLSAKPAVRRAGGGAWKNTGRSFFGARRPGIKGRVRPGQRPPQATPPPRPLCKSVRSATTKLRGEITRLIATWRGLRCDQRQRQQYKVLVKRVEGLKIEKRIKRLRLVQLAGRFPGPAKGDRFCITQYGVFSRRVTTKRKALRGLYTQMQRCRYR